MAAEISASNSIAPPRLQQPLLPQSPFSGTVQVLTLGVGGAVGEGVGVGVGVTTAVGVSGASPPHAAKVSSATQMATEERLTRIIPGVSKMNGREIGGLGLPPF